MNINRNTNITITPSSYLSCFTNDDLGTTTLYLSGCGESIAIQFHPDNLPVLETLISELQKLEIQSQQLKLQNLQHQISELNLSLNNVNGDCKAIVSAGEIF
ncbi:MAG: hypothetical protein PUP92_07515 [Rhizonema sp. PD38]|nr:hypothetical protein [Rhizonema sp. PD38]